MKIVNRQQFLALPPNTVFAKYSPCVCGPLEIKGETWGNDFLVTNNLAEAIDCAGSTEFADLLFDAQKTGASLKMDFESEGRDGYFDEDQLFAVWERPDVLALIERLKRCAP